MDLPLRNTPARPALYGTTYAITKGKYKGKFATTVGVRVTGGNSSLSNCHIRIHAKGINPKHGNYKVRCLAVLGPYPSTGATPRCALWRALVAVGANVPRAMVAKRTQLIIKYRF